MFKLKDRSLTVQTPFFYFVLSDWDATDIGRDVIEKGWRIGYGPRWFREPIENGGLLFNHEQSRMKQISPWDVFTTRI